ncbi:unnamed protein product [Phytophthora lilii]|uniref:Unnamed protein product n=1 Tax=Phytophthora lilii TaxID=2077276 RepID=A0A9W6TCR1_9STRA|nr:unnamed protein product [Phytophthora lilii]
MVQWLLAHFSDCPVGEEVVEEAARRGSLWVLQLLEADRSRGGIRWSDTSVDEAARAGSAFEQNNLAEVKWAIANGFRVRSISFPDCTEQEWAMRAEVLRFLLEGGHVLATNIVGVAAYRAARFGDFDFVKWLAAKYTTRIDVQYWVHALENASERAHLSIVEWILSNVDGVVRANGPSEAMFAAAENGKVDVVQWLYKQYAGKLNVDLFQELVVLDDSGEEEILSDDDLVPITAMDAAAKNGHLGVLQFLNDIDVA